MREKIFFWLRRLTLTWFGHSPATEQKQAELKKIEGRRTYMFDQTLRILGLIMPADGVAKKIVEVGIGAGGFTKRLKLAQKRALIVGIDPEVLSGNPTADVLVCGDGRLLPFGNRVADAAVSTFVLHLLVQPDDLTQAKRFIREARRVGKGIVLMDIVGSIWTVFFAPIGALLLERASLKFVVHTFRVMLSCLTRREYEKLAKELGLELFIWGPNPFFPKVAVLYTPPESE